MACSVLQALARVEKPTFSTELVTHDQEPDLPIAQRSEKRNALSALFVVVRPEWRDLGFAVVILETMKNLARKTNLQILVVPLRPTRKGEFPKVEMADHSSRRLGPGLKTVAEPCGENSQQGLGKYIPFGPWLRKYLCLRAQIVKVCPSSVTVDGDVAEWTELD